MKAIIIAAGTGIRLGKEKSKLPKALLEVNDQTILSRQISILKKMGIGEIIVITGPYTEKFPSIDVTYVNDQKFEEHDILGSLMEAREHIFGDVIITYSDIIFEDLILKNILQTNYDIGIPVDLNWEKSYEGRTQHPKSEADNVLIENGKIGEKYNIGANCELQNIEIDTINHESGSAQMEINFQHGNPLELADQVFLFKRTLRQAALKHKLYATFMAKPMENQPGRSLHLHQSLLNKKNKKNVFFSNKNTISNLMKNYIGGLQKFTPKLMPIHAPNINSYRRLFATWDAPKNTYWGIGNRSCGFRIPSNEEHSMRIENRISGSDTNPYLVFAANLAAGYLGVKNKIKPTLETKKSVFGEKKSSLPKNMEEAILLFEKDVDLVEVFNQKFIRTIAAIRRVEYQAYLKVISSWEREYLLLNV